MALFFRNNRNPNQTKNINSNSSQNTIIQPIQNQQDIQTVMQRDGINFKQLTEEDLAKINEEIRENIEKNRDKVLPTNIPKEKELFSENLKEFIQYEKNANKFYSGLSLKCTNKEHINRLSNISNECNLEVESMGKLFKNINDEIFSGDDVEINTDISLRQGLLLAIEEEVKIYDELCKLIEKMPVEDTRSFNSMALKKLGRINNIQNILLNLK